MTSIFFFLLFAFNAAISRRFCVCQPDRPGPVCTLNQKCNNFLNENQILLIQKNNQFKNTSSVNIFQIFQDIRKEGYDKIDLEFDVFGSLKSRPIIFDFTDAEKIINFDDNLYLSITIRGGEWKQIINFSGLNETSTILSKLSLSLQDISVLFDINNTASSKKSEPLISFDSFKVQKSRLIVPPGKYVTFNARDLYTDTISSYSDFNGKIIVDHLSYYDTNDPKIINNFNSPFQVMNRSTPITHNKKSILADDETSHSDSFIYNFCLSSKNRVDRALENLECDMHSVPADTRHYISVRSDDVIDIIRRAPSNKAIRFYLTAASLADPCSLVLPNFEGKNLSILFQVADPDNPTYLNLKSSNLDYNESYHKNNTISFHTIQTINIDTELLSTFLNVTLKLSQITFADSKENASVRNLITDSDSISEFRGTLNVQESIELKRTTPKRMIGSIILQNDSSLIVPQMSNFPHVLFNYNGNHNSNKLPRFYISLTDALEYVDMRFYFDQYRISLFLSDDLMTINDVINVTFRSDAPSLIDGFDRNDFSQSPYIYITTMVPAHGIHATFGEESISTEVQWPCRTVFYFESGLGPNETTFPFVYLSIHDADYFKSESDAPKSVFMIFRSVSIYLYGYPSFHPFLDGINYKYDPCPIDLYFEHTLKTRCYQVNGFNLINVTLNIGKELSGVMFEDKKLFLNTTASEIKVPDLFNLLNLITSVDSISYGVHSADHNISKTQNFTLNPTKVSTISFTDEFIEAYKNYYELNNTLLISHESTDIYLKTNEKPVPYVFLDDQVQGVHYVTISDGQAQTIDIDGNTFKTQSIDTRIGPNIIVNYPAQQIDIPQTAFLADTVKFQCSGPSATVNFYYWGESVADYTFEKTNIYIRSKNSWPHKSVVLEASPKASSNSNSVDFKAKSVSLDRYSRINRVNSNNLNFEVDRLSVSAINSIPSSSFSGPIIAHQSVVIVDSDRAITRIVFTSDSIQIFSNSLTEGTAVIKLIPLFSSSSSSSPSSSSHLLEDEEDDILPSPRVASTPGFEVVTDSNNPIDLSVDGTSVPDNFNLKLTGSDPQVVLDKSWNNVQVPDDFTINSENGKYKLETDLVELPNNFKSTGAVVNHRKQKLTKDVGFIVFIVIFAVVFIIGIILCVYGLTCFPSEEAYDFTSDVDGADLIEDDDSNVDRSVELDEIEKKKEKEEKMKPDESETTGVIIDQQTSTENDSGTDSNFFDEADNNDTVKSKVK